MARSGADATRGAGRISLSALTLGASSDRETTISSRRAAHLARLAYDELLANQLALSLLTRAIMRQSAGKARIGDGRLRAKIVAALPFSLTGSQTQRSAEIETDLAALNACCGCFRAMSARARRWSR